VCPCTQICTYTYNPLNPTPNTPCLINPTPSIHPQAAFFDRVDLSAHGYYAVADDRCGYDWEMQTDKNWERGQPFNYFTQGGWV
jgi:hypothetical protein